MLVEYREKGNTLLIGHKHVNKRRQTQVLVYRKTRFAPSSWPEIFPSSVVGESLFSSKRKLDQGRVDNKGFLLGLRGCRRAHASAPLRVAEGTKAAWPQTTIKHKPTPLHSFQNQLIKPISLFMYLFINQLILVLGCLVLPHLSGHS